MCGTSRLWLYLEHKCFIATLVFLSREGCCMSWAGIMAHLRPVLIVLSSLLPPFCRWDRV